ncbi:hypothetical protein L6164_024307 [Bauhinia variegata]|uniref:Uncharacterized protein n=1 Tax=Bauhinia variegata TaxID=167791 RepID=A0ACB9LYB0_BAUVA|nr:hypothetical protein L6164_024307 [Bauhinia variegata]
MAVELDTFMNEFDIDANHIGIDTRRFTNPIAAVSLNSTAVDLKGGRDIEVKINCDVYVGFTASTGQTLPESHRVLNWVFTSVPIPFQTVKPTKHGTIKTLLIIVMPIFVVVLFSSLPFIWEALRKDNATNDKEEDIQNTSMAAEDIPKMFAYQQLSKATCNFSRENLLDRGGFGSVYKGIMSDPPKAIAVKKISATSKQGEREHFAEICRVKLQGWCHDGVHLLLVYDYMQNGSLDLFIGKDILDWQTRHKININRIGISIALPSRSVIAQRRFRKATPESDVYSFGMLALEVIRGRRSKGISEENGLVDYVWNLHSQNALLECADKQLKNQFDEKEVKRALMTGLAWHACVQIPC